MRLIGVLIFLCQGMSCFAQNNEIIIPAGAFKPLANWEIVPGDEMKVYQVKEFRLSKYEVTTGEYVQYLNEVRPDSMKMELFCCGSLPPGIEFNAVEQEYRCAESRVHVPVTHVSWYGAKAYCEWKGGRLPSDVEWFYAAAGGNFSFPFPFSGSDQADEVAVFNTSGPKRVGSKKPNQLGLYDMSGNVSEWTDTGVEASILYVYKYTDYENSGLKVISNGSWRNLQDLFLNLHNIGFVSDPQRCRQTIGFRVAFD